MVDGFFYMLCPGAGLGVRRILLLVMRGLEDSVGEWRAIAFNEGGGKDGGSGFEEERTR